MDLIQHERLSREPHDPRTSRMRLPSLQRLQICSSIIWKRKYWLLCAPRTKPPVVIRSFTVAKEAFQSSVCG